MDDAIDGADPRLGGIRPSEIATRRAVQMVGPDGKPLSLLDNVFPATPSGKIELRSEALAERWGAAAALPAWRPPHDPTPHAVEGSAGVPLMLISPASDKRISSTLGDLAVSRAVPPLLMNPKDAALRNLGPGNQVRVRNERGEVILRLIVTDAVRPGVVASEKGAWLMTSPTGQTISALVSADLKADLAEGACFNDTAVEVSRVTL